MSKWERMILRVSGIFIILFGGWMLVLKDQTGLVAVTSGIVALLSANILSKKED